MQNLVKIICLAVLNVSLAFAQANNNPNITVNISNLNSDNGKLFVSIYTSEASFLKKRI